MGGRTVELGATGIPARIAPAGPLVAAISWRPVRDGVSMATLPLRAGALDAPVEAVIVRADPRRLRFSLARRTTANGMTGSWSIDSAGPDAVLAMNAGQFKETGPWGWLVLDGYEHRNPLRAPLGVGLVIDRAGTLRFVAPGGEARLRHDARVRFAFQSFPLLWYDRRVPAALRDATLTNLAHRDARLVLAEADDGSLLIVLTRFAGLGAVAERLPIGLTVPETVALVAALGARHAVMLDGGVSAQLLLRDAAGDRTAWRGLRAVPLGLVAGPRPED